MRTERVVVVGAGIGGLVAALELARHGLAVTVLERAATPGGKMREVEVAGRRLDAGPTVFTMRAVFEEIFADAGTSLSSEITLQPAPILARHAWSADERLDLFVDVERSAEAIGAFASPAEAQGFRAFCAHAKRVYETLDRTFIRAERPAGPMALARRVAMQGLGDLLKIDPFAKLWPALGRHFGDPRLRQLFGRYATYLGSSPFQAPATLMLIAHVEQSGVLAGRGRHAPAGRRPRPARRGQWGPLSLSGRRQRGRDQRRAGRRRPAHDRRADRSRRGRGQCRRRGASSRSARSQNGRCPARHQPGRAVAIRGDLEPRRTNERIPFAPPHRLLLERLSRGVRRPVRPTPPAPRPDRLCLRPGPERPRRFRARRSGASPLPGQRTSHGRHPRLRRPGDRDMRDEDLRPARACRPADPSAAGRDRGDDAPGLRAAVPGDRRGALRPGHARLDGVVSPARLEDPDPGPLPRGRQHPSGRRGADGGALGAPRRIEPAGRPRFDRPVAPGGYAWWYVDALSDDGRHALTLIAFIGSVFSPYYALARRRGRSDPEDHVALNVALYGETGKRWAMTERGRAGLTRSEDVLSIGPSAMRFDGDGLTIEIDEVAVPRPARIRGRVRVVPEAITGRVFDLDGHGRHRWSPIAPSARVEVALERPALRWHGTAYLDSNDGDEPLEDSFVRWDWSRASADGISTILYEPTLRAGERAPLALRIDRAGAITEVGSPPAAPLPPTRWRMERATRAEEPGAASVIETLEDAPFYARSLLRTRLFGMDLTAVHESLSLDRFRHPVVQLMLPFRMPRRARWTPR